MRIIKIDPKNYSQSELAPAADALRKGGLVAFPTETVYGIAVNADMPESVERLRKLKKSPMNRPFTYHISDIDDFYKLAKNPPETAERLARAFWPGPLTLVLDDDSDKTIGIRFPSHPVARDLIRFCGVPVIAPSANLAGQPPPKEAKPVIDSFGSKLDIIIDSGPAFYGVSSTVIKVTQDNKWEIIRGGSIAKEDLQPVLTKIIMFVCTGNTCRSPMAEGLFRKMLSGKLGVAEPELERKGYKILSAGIAAGYGISASEKAVTVLKEYGADILQHRSQPVTLDLLNGASYIYVMTREHFKALVAWKPAAAEKIFMLDPSGEDISDPIGGGLEEYRQAAFKIKNGLENVLNKIINDK
ncbi:MAG: threonylcarbamoyl-AMP synthase [Planctomycetes bacterium]|nr:threonylcarbamoyl-AMP synthase [Planctomycetota bacterium]